MFVKFRKFQPQYSYDIYILFKKNKEFIHEINHYEAVTLSPWIGIYPVDSSIYLLKKLVPEWEVIIVQGHKKVHNFTIKQGNVGRRLEYSFSNEAVSHKD